MDSDYDYYIKKNMLLRNTLDKLNCEILECVKEIDLFVEKFVGKRKNKTIDMNRVVKRSKY